MSDAPVPDAAAAAAAAAAPPPAPPAEPAVADWRTTLPDDLKADPGIANYTSVEALARGVIETKALVGRDKVVLPKDDADEAGWNEVYTRLGRPEKPDGYEIKIPDGAPTAYADAFRPVAHKLGLSAKQVSGLVEFNNQAVAEAMAAQSAASVADLATLKTQLGPDYERKVAIGKQAAKAFGVKGDIADALDDKLGSRALVELFINIGEKMGEHGRLEPGDPPGGVSADPEGERAALTKDQEFVKKLNGGDVEAKARWDRLNKAIVAKRTGGA